MAARTITIEDDVYERLSRLRRDDESFSDVLRRELEHPSDSPVKTVSRPTSGAKLLQAMDRWNAEGIHLTNDQLDTLDEAQANDEPPKDAWR